MGTLGVGGGERRSWEGNGRLDPRVVSNMLGQTPYHLARRAANAAVARLLDPRTPISTALDQVEVQLYGPPRCAHAFRATGCSGQVFSSCWASAKEMTVTPPTRRLCWCEACVCCSAGGQGAALDDLDADLASWPMYLSLAWLAASKTRRSHMRLHILRVAQCGTALPPLTAPCPPHRLAALAAKALCASLLDWLDDISA
jgi:hypothetical protein